jgi:hypothetical protein
MLLEVLNDINPGESIRPADPVVFDRISSESDIFHKKPIGSDRVFVGFRPGFRRNSTEPDEIRVGSGRISIMFRRIPTKSGPEFDKNSVGSDRNFFDPTGSDGIRSLLSHMGVNSHEKQQ